jgi:hypothetical protein
MTEDEALEILRATSFSDPATIGAVDSLWGTEAGVSAAARVLASTTPTYEVLWAATYIYAGAGGDPSVLAALINHSGPTIRLLAAAGLVARGDKRGFKPLVECLGHTEFLTWSRPPRAVWKAAAAHLAQFTGISELGPPFDADLAVVAASQRKWQDWLGANENRLTFDSLRGEWNLV